MGSHFSICRGKMEVWLHRQVMREKVRCQIHLSFLGNSCAGLCLTEPPPECGLRGRGQAEVKSQRPPVLKAIATPSTRGGRATFFREVVQRGPCFYGYRSVGLRGPDLDEMAVRMLLLSHLTEGHRVGSKGPAVVTQVLPFLTSRSV